MELKDSTTSATVDWRNLEWLVSGDHQSYLLSAKFRVSVERHVGCQLRAGAFLARYSR